MTLKFSMGTKFDMENTKIKEKLDIDTFLINYSWFVKTAPMDLKFGTETKFHMENTKIKEKLEIDTFSLIIHDLSKLRGGGGGDGVLDVDYKNEGPE